MTTSEGEKKDRMQLLVRRVFLIIIDIFWLNATTIFALLIRFDMHLSYIPPEYWRAYVQTCIPFTIIGLCVFWVCRMYHSLWQYASIAEAYRIFEACILTEIFYAFLTMITFNNMPRSVYFVAGCFLILAECFTRFFYRTIRQLLHRWRGIKDNNDSTRIMIIGAGEAANILVRELQMSRYLAGSEVVCLIDDDPGKKGKYIRGVRVVGGRDKIRQAAKDFHVDEIIFAVPSCSNEEKGKILNICKETSCRLKIIPGV